jgi:hypothetical protein
MESAPSDNAYRLKSSIFVEVDDLCSTGSSKVFLSPSQQWEMASRAEEYGLKASISFRSGVPSSDGRLFRPPTHRGCRVRHHRFLPLPFPRETLL